MKRIFALVIVLVMALSMVGCSDKVTDILNKEILNKELTRGTVDGNVYTSEYIGLSFVKPDSWVYSTDEEINELMGATNDIMNRTDYEAAVADLATVFDMMVIDSATSNNVNIVYENLALSGSTDITMEEYLDITKKNFEAIPDFSYTFSDATNVTLGGVEFTKLECDLTYMELISMKQALYMKKVGNYMVLISFTIIDGTDESVIEGYFTEIK